MSDRSNNSMETVGFRRFLSYIYAYEDDTKLRNVGFAKVEVRSQRVRFQVTVNGILQKGGRPLELCLVDGNLNRVPVGQIMLQNGHGEYRGSSNMDNLWDTGISFSQIYGICLQGAGNRRHYYMTLWREIPGPVREAHNQIVIIPRNKEQKSEGEQVIHAAEVRDEQEELEAEQGEEEEAVQSEGIETGGNTEIESVRDTDEEVTQNVELKIDKKVETEIMSVEVEPSVKSTAEQTEAAIESTASSEILEQLESVSELIIQQSSEDSNREEGVPQMTEQSDRKKKREDKSMELWKRFCSRYPHVDIRPESMDDRCIGDGFAETGKICEVLRIRPNDIGRLPRNNWILAHNSFLQHAYNHSHQLILFRVEKQGMEPASHWFIGLPGEKSEQETLVAEVFGFKKFLKCKNGGFWYTEINMGVY